MPSIEITVSPKGETQVATHGFVGSSCREASKFLERALGYWLGERLTQEFYHTPTQAIQPTQSTQHD